MSKYNVNFKRLALLMLPTFWRKPLIATMTYAAVSPLGYLHTRFMKFRNDNNYRLTHNGQVCYLRAVLNDMFDPLERRITVTDNADNIGNVTLYRRELGKAMLLSRRGSGKFTIINRRGFGGINSFDFLVNIPQSLMQSIDISRVRAIVCTYKLASKRFAINYI